MFDITLFSRMEKHEPTVYFNDSIDVISLKILYDNCVRVGTESNNNISIATAHPDLWFGEYFDFFRTKIKMVAKQPSFQLIRIEGNNLVVSNYICDSIEFQSDEELKMFLENIDEYRSIAIFSLVKYVDIKTFKSSWRLRFIDISTKDEVRDKKIETVISKS